jgi:hypothetical protein
MEKTILQSILLVLSLPFLHNLVEGLVARKIPPIPMVNETIARQESPVLYWLTVAVNVLLASVLYIVIAVIS